MSEFSKDKKTRRAERKKMAKTFSKAHGFKEEEILDILRDNPNNYKQELDRKAFSNITDPVRYRAGMEDKLTTNNMRNLGGMPPKLFGTIPLGTNINGKAYGIKSDVDRFAQMVDKDFEKSIGHSLHGRGVTTGYGHTKAQAAMASRGTRVADFMGHMNPLGASSRDSIMTSMGFAGRDSRILAAKGNFMESMNRRVLGPAFGMYMAASSLQSDSPLTEYATGVAVGAGLQQGWRAGKSFGNIISASHKFRIAGGLVGGGLAAAVPAALIMGHADMFKNDSFIAKQAKQIYSRETFASSRDTQTSLTMRQAGLEKLSSSYLNNRQQLLGNEASILKNSQA